MAILYSSIQLLVDERAFESVNPDSHNMRLLISDLRIPPPSQRNRTTELQRVSLRRRSLPAFSMWHISNAYILRRVNEATMATKWGNFQKKSCKLLKQQMILVSCKNVI